MKAIKLGCSLLAAVAGGLLARAGSDDVDLRYSYVQFTGSQWVDTKYTHQLDTTVELVFYAPQMTASNKSYSTLFGAFGSSDVDHSMGFLPWNTYVYSTVDAAYYVRDSYVIGAAQENGAQTFIYNDWVKMVCDANGASWWKIDGTGERRQVTVDQKMKTAGVSTLYINGYHGANGSAGKGMGNGVWFRSFKISETSGVKRDYLPMRLADGRSGFYDTVTKAFATQAGTYGGALFAVSEDGTTIRAHEGTLAAFDIIDFTAVEKRGTKVLNATAVTAYPALSISEGTLSFQNSEAATYAVAGTLKLVGGAKVAMDVTANGNDAFNVTSLVDLSEASESNPFVFALALVGDVQLGADGVTLISSGCSAGDVAKVTIEGAPLSAAVRNGALVAVPAAATPVTARWIGGGDHANLSDVKNWICQSIDGTEIPNASPTANTAIVVPAGNCSFNWPAGATIPCRSVTVEAGGLVLTDDCDWTGIPLNDPFFNALSVNLNGHSLTLAANNGASAYPVTVTSTIAGGRLVIDVPKDATFTNTKIALSGSLKLVKTGAGTFVANYSSQSYSGGTQIVAGTFKPYNDTKPDSSTYAASSKYWVGARESTVWVEEGATFDINGVYDFYVYSFVSNGGTFINSKAQNYRGNWGGLGNLTLEADTQFNLDNSIQLNGIAGLMTFDLNGHTLTMDIKSGDINRRAVNFINGTFVVTGGGCLVSYDRNYNFETVTLDLGAKIDLTYEATVSNLVTRYTGSATAGTKTIHVLNAFKPMCDRFQSVTLHDGATLDLSEREGAWSVLSAFGNTLLYDSNARHITIDIGARTPGMGEQLVVWTSAPANVEFSVKGDNVKPEDTLNVGQSGIFFNAAADSPVVASAEWTGEAGDFNAANPTNWCCRNAAGYVVKDGLPAAEASVVLKGVIGIDFTGASMPWATLTIEDCSLARDCDWTGLGAYTDYMATDTTIDLCGHALSVTAPSGTATKALTVTDSTTNADAPGEFRFTVADKVTFADAGTKFTGNLRLVKKGAGTYTPQMFNHTYSGGTVLAEGMLKLYNDTTADSSTYAVNPDPSFKYPYPLGAHGSTVTIKAGTSFDINGVYDLHDHNFVVEGGAFVNSKAQTKANWGTLGNVVLTTNAVMSVGKSIVVGFGPFDLGGYALDVQIANGQNLYLGNNLQLTNGTLRTRSTSGVGALYVYSAKNAKTVDFDIGTKLDMQASLDVHDYTANFRNSANSGTAALNVWGTFSPLAVDGEKDYFYGCTLQNGSTIDLSQRTGEWNTVSSFASGAKEVTFAENATIRVNLAGREITFPKGKSVVKIINWNTLPPPTTTEFTEDAETKAIGRRLLKREDGLYLMKSLFTIIIR